MEIKIQPMGTYQTNCYIITIDNKDIIVDPGVNATQWVISHTQNPVAILNTHGHFDHVWSNRDLQNELKIPLYIPKDDAFMLQDDPFGQGTPTSKPDVLVDGDGEFNIEGIKVKYRHFPGHTPGNSIIEIEDIWLSGDFLFDGSIGRWDFPYSSGEDMIKSLQKAMKIEKDFTLYPGHGISTTLKKEQRVIPQWIEYVKHTL
ncbi:MAG: MBL fold metallo-hydrolase [Epsilonproteobacteria bacterium]|nr:MBL fold metallo-hydrolase [Campylobacterota bacterium]